jgi:transcriptional regulator with XRE-family HTH domain
MAIDCRAQPAHKRLVSILIRERRRRGLKQVEVAKLMGRSQTWIARIESGQRRIDICEFRDFARLYDIDPLKLWTRITEDS